MTPWIIVGLGNPGREHAQSRHNVGFRCVDLLAERHTVRLTDRRAHVIIGQGAMGGRPIVAAKPRTYVNASGIAVRYLAQRFGASHDKVLIVTDDMDLPMGQLRLRASGGSGGHHGLDSIIAELGTQSFPRLRVGIGRPQGEAVEHVLGPFSRDEEMLLAQALERAADAVEAWVAEGVEAAMNRFN
jgi:PTH1 family peptidyl-tRNA hydrolase